VRFHFYEPLSDSGNWGYGVARNSAEWAINDSADNEYTWSVARDSLYGTLTGRSRTDRFEAWLGLMPTPPERARRGLFLTLGHVMHLIQDAASPPHTRADYHGEGPDVPDLLESPAADHRVVTRAVVEGLAPIAPDPILLRSPSANGLPSPVSNLWDSGRYQFRHDCAFSTDLAIAAQFGIAEFSSSLFFSDDTIGFFSFPPPCPDANAVQCASGSCARCESEVGICPVLQGDGPTGNGPRFLSAAVALRNAREYLVPRAIGYSAAAFDFFFLGILPSGEENPMELEPSHDPNGLAVTNNLDWDLVGGRLELWIDDEQGVRTRAESGPSSLSAGETFVFPPVGTPRNGLVVAVYRGPMSLDGDVREEDGIAARVCRCTDGLDDPATGCEGVCCGGALVDPGDCNQEVRYTDNGDGTITDHCTGLMWEQKTGVPGRPFIECNPCVCLPEDQDICDRARARGECDPC